MEKKDRTEITFEQALTELEATVRSLETGNLSLDESLKVFERGIFLSRICNQKLEEVDQKIDLLITGNDGSIKLAEAKNIEDGDN